MPKVLKLADLSPVTVGALFQTINHNRIFYYKDDPFDPNNKIGVIVSEFHPSRLNQLDGWTCVKIDGKLMLTNKGHSSSGERRMIPFVKLDGSPW